MNKANAISIAFFGFCLAVLHLAFPGRASQYVAPGRVVKVGLENRGDRYCVGKTRQRRFEIGVRNHY